MIFYVIIIFATGIFAVWSTNKTLNGKKIWVKNPTLRLNYSFYDWTHIDYLALTITACVALLFIIALLQTLGRHFGTILPELLFAAICITTLIYSTSYYNLPKWYQRYSGTFKVVAALATVVFTLIATPMADATILSYTHIDAAQFPAAQKMLTFIGVVGIWGYVAMCASLPAYILAFLHLAKPIYLERKDMRSRSYIYSCTAPRKHHLRNLNLALASLLGVSFTVTFLLNELSAVRAESIDENLKRILVFASFHLPAQACGIQNSSTSLVALINDNRAVVATPDRENTFLFNTEKCDMQPVNVTRKRMPPTPTLFKIDVGQSLITPTSMKACNARRCSLLINPPGPELCL